MGRFVGCRDLLRTKLVCDDYVAYNLAKHSSNVIGLVDRIAAQRKGGTRYSSAYFKATKLGTKSIVCMGPHLFPIHASYYAAMIWAREIDGEKIYTLV